MIFLEEVLKKSQEVYKETCVIQKLTYNENISGSTFAKMSGYFGRNQNLGKFERIMEKIWKSLGVNLNKLNYPEHAVVIEGTKLLIVDRLNDSSPATYLGLYSFLFIWRKFERILEKHERISGNIWRNSKEILKELWRILVRIL